MIELENFPRSHRFTPAEAADALGIKEGTLAVWRSTGRYPLPYVRIGRKIFYRGGDLTDFIESRVATHTGEHR
jgi:predicted site-specific integrase-resolvase